jgi:pimeloyl-ACP methyl ester carboxylesterase
VQNEDFLVHTASPRGFTQAFVHERTSQHAPTIVCVHGWPETKRIFWRVIAPLRDAGFNVVVPDLRGFGDSDIAPDGYNDVAAHAEDILVLVRDHLGYDKVVLAGGDLGGPIIQHLALSQPEWVGRMVLFNSPLPYEKATMSHLDTRPPRASMDYFIRQATDADGLIGELQTESARMNYIATFYTSRYWAHPGSFSETDVRFHSEPFAGASKLRATFANYESSLPGAAISAPVKLASNNHTKTLIMFGPSDRVLYPDFDKMAALVFTDHVGPFLLRDCGHFVPWEAPHQFFSGTVAFCSDLLR